ncbi:MAG: hypothetical protein IIC87_05330 [Chloroflexi bacterium]|nr:hypothetical protein [Chloroflexota bacterium]
MSTKVIVMVSDRDNAKRGEITVADNPRTAAYLVETLLEAGLQQEQIKLYSGDEAEVRISSRLIVALVDDCSTPTAPESVEPYEAATESADEEATPFVKNGVRFSSLFRPANLDALKDYRAPALRGAR